MNGIARQSRLLVSTALRCSAAREGDVLTAQSAHAALIQHRLPGVADLHDRARVAVRRGGRSEAATMALHTRQVISRTKGGDHGRPGRS